MERSFTIKFEQEEPGGEEYRAECLELPGVVARGVSVAEIMNGISEAIRDHLRDPKKKRAWLDRLRGGPAGGRRSPFFLPMTLDIPIRPEEIPHDGCSICQGEK